MAFDNFFNWIFGPIINNFSPFWSLFILSLIFTIFITLAHKYLTNQTEIKRLKDESKELRKQMKDSKDDKDKLMELQKISLEKTMQMMKHTIMNPKLFLAMAPLLLAFPWLSKTFKGSGDLISWGFNIPLFGTGFGWLGTYLITALIFNGLVRKALKVH